MNIFSMLCCHLDRFLLIVLLVIPDCSSFSVSNRNHPTPKPKILPITTRHEEPTILSLSNVFTHEEVDDILQLVESSALNPTSTYQEDVFSIEAWDAEDAILRKIVQPLLDDGTIPPNHSADSAEKEAALRSFVYAVTNHPDRIAQDDIIVGANIIQRREAIERWKSDEGLSIMKLSMDYDMMKEEGDTLDIDWDVISLGKRYEVPPELLDKIEHVIPTVLNGGTSWTTTDATIVKYQEGDLQVPHIDPCDATLLICLQPCMEGGSTCFPLLDPPRRLENARGDGYLFFSSQATGRERNVLSLHHGGRVVKGDKIVMQLMLEYNGNGDEDLQRNLMSKQVVRN
ncbi:hypothetical protein ACHAWT_000383 [Skeletonema menzelii]